MGGAPAGPAGTGKTETTKDLGRALGMMVYVFNCSEQMDYKSCGNIYKGLAQTGAFGCFDEFNRISVEALSVVAIQVKSILDALKGLIVIELEEILEIRHSVFIIGAAGVGKSCVWKTLFQTYQKLGKDPMYSDLNPKAVTNDELFGVVHGVTREWQDGLFSIIMRDQAYASNVGPKWIVADGDIDPMWIESLNTVMDDNKVLTLANNERIPLTPSMRLVFEIGHLRAATPATVSRAGILYINNQDVGYQPLILSWIEGRKSDGEKIILNHLFNKYVPVILEAIHTKFTTIIPLVDVALVRTTCSLLDSLLTPENVPPNSPNE
uniref:Dynein heavy chain hydrolytic ATP-binding dynein motor region domain-containing protein n=1 Tax=Phlebotomus papatasi TaxID=29031 RepID=A0A1B0DHB0_PHLPP